MVCRTLGLKAPPPGVTSHLRYSTCNVVIRLDDGGRFNGGKLGKLCREGNNKKQDFTTADSPEYNGVAERGLAMLISDALAARIQAPELFPGLSVPGGSLLWVEAMNWACDAYHRTANAYSCCAVIRITCPVHRFYPQ